jgi:hypothetical protein
MQSISYMVGPEVGSTGLATVRGQWRAWRQAGRAARGQRCDNKFSSTHAATDGSAVATTAGGTGWRQHCREALVCTGREGERQDRTSMWAVPLRRNAVSYSQCHSLHCHKPINSCRKNCSLRGEEGAGG